DLLILITAYNRGPDPATIHLLPQIWFRNTWSWGLPTSVHPHASSKDHGRIDLEHPILDGFHLHYEDDPTRLFCENETNPKIFGDSNSTSGFFKDAFHQCVVDGDAAAVNPALTGTKAALHYELIVPAQKSVQVRLRLTNANHPKPFDDFDATFAPRVKEADEFYATLQKDMADADARNVQRQAFAGMLWSKQFYYYDVPEWLHGDPAQPPPPLERLHGRNSDWENLNNADILSMPDKWEYPWFAAWDLAFHCIPLAMIDPEFAKGQLVLLTREWYMHPNGQLPAYEWAFGDVNPPVHAWASWRVFQIDRKQRQSTNPADAGDVAFLERVFHKLLLNFTWWVNRKDSKDRNIFQGGFLGLDNIGVFDRSSPLPTGGFIDQADGTSWMAMYSLNLMRMALELARHNKVYEDIASKFFEHFLQIAEAMNKIGDHDNGLWSTEDEFYYDVLNLPDGRTFPLKVRSLVGLIPLFAVEVLEGSMYEEVPCFTARLEWFLNHRPEMAKLVSRWVEPGMKERHLLSLLRGHRMKALLRRMLDETEFLSEFGVRALSRWHLDHPYEFGIDGTKMTVRYEPAESTFGHFGGNSNWRGPIWMPVNYLIIESLQKFHHYYGNDFKIEFPTRSGKFITIQEVAAELTRRLTRLFLKNGQGQRPVLKYHPKQATDPNFRDYVLFHEYFNGDNGAGLGAPHQTGWTGLIAKLLQPRQQTSSLTPDESDRNGE
ncbi:MAG: hypothetical protein JWM99_3553, partial [Verrucomicrobiales bacterium]|nr:hypothetical protein [Verrucomicrobiales bacterium]